MQPRLLIARVRQLALDNEEPQREDETMNIPEEIKKQFATYGSIGGKKAAANMTPEQRIERAKKAVKKREENRKAKSK